MYPPNQQNNLGAGLQFQPRKYFGAADDGQGKADLKKSSIFFSTPQQQAPGLNPNPAPKLEFGAKKLEFKQSVTGKTPPAFDGKVQFSVNAPIAQNNSGLLAPTSFNTGPTSSKPAMYSSQIVSSSSNNFKTGTLGALGKMAKNVNEPQTNNNLFGKPATTSYGQKFGSSGKEAINPFSNLDSMGKAVNTGSSAQTNNFSSQSFSYSPSVSISPPATYSPSPSIPQYTPSSSSNYNSYSTTDYLAAKYDTNKPSYSSTSSSSSGSSYGSYTSSSSSNNNGSSYSQSSYTTSSYNPAPITNDYLKNDYNKYTSPSTNYSTSVSSSSSYSPYTPSTYEPTPISAPPPASFAKKAVRFDTMNQYNASKNTYEPQVKPSTSTTTKNSRPEQLKLTKNDFIIGKCLGKGQFGQVFLVKHKATGFVCALKTIKKTVIKEQKVEEQILRELKIQFFLKHNNIVQLYGFFHDKECVYLLLEICCDGQLYDLLKKERRISETRASEIVKQICLGIDRIHRQKIIHRDIKPENVILNCVQHSYLFKQKLFYVFWYQGVAKICDFGWAVYRGNGLRITFCGTPLYTPPEMIRGEEYDQAVDIWGIGILTYEMIVGRIPFKIYSQNDFNKIVKTNNSPTLISMLFNFVNDNILQLTDEITFPDHVDISSVTKDFILKILKRNKEERYEIEDLLCHPFLKLHTQTPGIDFGGFSV